MEKEHLEERGREGNSLDGSGNISHSCRFYGDGSLKITLLEILPSCWKSPVQVGVLKLEPPYSHSKSALANTY